MDARPLGMKSWVNSLLKVPGGLEALGLWVRLCPHHDPALQTLQPLFPGLLPTASDGSGALGQPSSVSHLFSPIPFHSGLRLFQVGGQASPCDPVLAGSQSVFKGFWIASCLAA